MGLDFVNYPFNGLYNRFSIVMERFSLSWTNLVSITFIGFAVTLFIIKLYTRIRSHFQITVNCWFCNRNTKVQYADYNSWNCPHCDQYNGFAEDGDYNRDIAKQKCNVGRRQFARTTAAIAEFRRENGFCQTCNDNQAIKVEKLAAFEPDNEITFVDELRQFQEGLEETYRLCRRCEKNLRRVLADKKKMVLGLRLAQKSSGRPAKRKSFPKAHFRKAIWSERFKRLTTIGLFTFALLNWIDIANSLRLNRDRMLAAFGPITTSILIFVFSHLVTLTKVLVNYFTGLFRIHLVEKIFMFLRTVTALAVYTAGFDFHKEMKFFGALVPIAIPFGSMFLAFGAHICDGFKLTRTTLLLAVWSIYTSLTRGDTLEEYAVLKALASFAILLLSIPSFERKTELQRILDSTVNSFHRIQSDDYLPEENQTISKYYHTRASDTTASLSSNSFSDSFSTTHPNLSSSCFNLSPSPVSALRSYSIEQLNSTRPRNVASERFNFNPTTRCLSPNNGPISPPIAAYSPRPNNVLNRTLDCSTPRSFTSAKSFATCRSSQRNLLSPSHFNHPTSNLFCTAYAQPSLSHAPYLSTGQFFYNDKPDNRKNFYLNTVVPHETNSRESSQSSGFESHASSTMQPAALRENSIGYPEADPAGSIYSEPLLQQQQQPLDLHRTVSHAKSFEAPPPSFLSVGSHPPSPPSFLSVGSHPQSPPPKRGNIFQSKIMDFESGDHWVRNSPIDNRRQAFKADYLANLSVDCSSMAPNRTNPFDFNGMHSFLPPIRKRYNLLRNIDETSAALPTAPSMMINFHGESGLK